MNGVGVSMAQLEPYFLHITKDIERYRQTPGEAIVLTAVRALYSHPAFAGVLWYRLSRFFWVRRRNPLWWVCLAFLRVLYPLVRIHSGLELAPSADLGPGLWIGHMGPTVIHPATVAGRHLTVLHGTTIGEGTGGVPRLGNDVSIGAGATLVGGIRIGDGATIGAGAVVTKDVAPGTLAVGVPAKALDKAHRTERIQMDHPAYSQHLARYRRLRRPVSRTPWSADRGNGS